MIEPILPCDTCGGPGWVLDDGEGGGGGGGGGGRGGGGWWVCRGLAVAETAAGTVVLKFPQPVRLA